MPSKENSTKISRLSARTLQSPTSHFEAEREKFTFDDYVDVHPSDEVSQDTMFVAHGEETFPDRYINDLQWTMQYIDSSKKVVLITSRNKSQGQVAKERPPFGYDWILRLDYEDPDLDNLVILVEFTKGLCKVWVREILASEGVF